MRLVSGLYALAQRVAYRVGLGARRRWERDRLAECPPGATSEERRLWASVCTTTMTSPERVLALRRAVRRVVAEGIPGDIVECGVWRGGSMLAAALTLAELGETTRDIYLFDTFTGMPEPTEQDRHGGQMASTLLAQSSPDSLVRAESSLATVRRTMSRSGYPASRIHYIEGRVEETIPDRAPESIALLRLDTDWYLSTQHELQHLWPRLSVGGVLIVNDYGHWEGARQAVNEWLAARVAGGEPELALELIDYTGRLLVKPAAGCAT